MQLELAARQSLARSLKETERIGDSRVRRDGKEYVSFSCNDYLGLAHDPRVIAAARDALERHGAGAGASRLVTGSHPRMHRSNICSPSSRGLSAPWCLEAAIWRTSV